MSLGIRPPCDRSSRLGVCKEWVSCKLLALDRYICGDVLIKVRSYSQRFIFRITCRHSMHRTTGEIRSRSKGLQSVYTAIIRDGWAAPPRLWHAIAKRLFPHTKCPIMARKNDIEDLVASLAWRNEGKSPEDILPLGVVINIIYDSMKEHGLRVEDYTRVRDLVRLIAQMKDLLEDREEEVEDKYRKHGMSRADDSGSRNPCPFMSSNMSDESSVKDPVLEGRKEEVEDEIGEYDVSGADDSDSRMACSNLSSDASEASSVVWSEYTVRSVVSWKERTSWFFRLAHVKRT
ncbi:hypothetical protein EDB92DRAFT_437691 [Lactarius akahatsu]|uniref:Uncharacterized protein n=1 Tax=Lactarius akahatsu TaxID=416441 RepID=A0AAD4QEC7_9AGAM|nr:hypothetical protein EDB92DRAFT_437691 [Lactarius akahatsu]